MESNNKLELIKKPIFQLWNLEKISIKRLDLDSFLIDEDEYCFYPQKAGIPTIFKKV